jgi:uncharacterized protein YggE
MIRSVDLRLVVFCCLSLAHSGPALAQSPDTLPETLRKLFESIPTPRLDTLGLARAGLISMDGEGSVRVRPDTARIRVGVVSEAAVPGEVAQQNASRMSAVLDAIKKTVGEPSLSSGSVELRTEAVTLTPIYAVHQDPQRRNPMVSGYRANNSVQITVRDLDQRSPGFLGAIIEQANKVGANEISGPEFIVFNDAKPLVEARVNLCQGPQRAARTSGHRHGGRAWPSTDADDGQSLLTSGGNTTRRDGHERDGCARNRHMGTKAGLKRSAVEETVPDPIVFAGTVEWSGENPGISLKETPDGPFVALASFFRVVLSPHGRGHALVLLQSPNEAVRLTWSGLGEPFCFALPPDKSATGKHHMPSLFVGCDNATIAVNGRTLWGRPVPREIAGRTITSAMLAFSETWIRTA